MRPALPPQITRPFVVLVVEDNELVRFNAVAILEDAGMVVVEAGDADQAWDILLARDDIAVLFTDVDMPGSMCGVTLAGRVRLSWPGIGLIVTSGRSRPEGREIPIGGLFLPKPYGISQIVDAIHRSVSRRRSVEDPDGGLGLSDPRADRLDLAMDE